MEKASLHFLFKSALPTLKLRRQAPPQEMKNVAILQRVGKAQALVIKSLLFITISLQLDFDSRKKKSTHYDGIFVCTRVSPQSPFTKCYIVNRGLHQKQFKYLFLKVVTCSSKKYIIFSKHIFVVTNIYFDLNTEFNLHILIHRLQKTVKFIITI